MRLCFPLLNQWHYHSHHNIFVIVACEIVLFVLSCLWYPCLESPDLGLHLVHIERSRNMTPTHSRSWRWSTHGGFEPLRWHETMIDRFPSGWCIKILWAFVRVAHRWTRVGIYWIIVLPPGWVLEFINFIIVVVRNPVIVVGKFSIMEYGFDTWNNLVEFDFWF